MSVSSAAHTMGGLDVEDLNWERRKYSPWLAYGASKLANVLFAKELARRYGLQARGACYSMRAAWGFELLGAHWWHW